ncbi:hypothetical protein [Candidatus Amarolinea dominans]|uniref:hypothetical protein n=1 Tax=Candidatus Amarolinea dominans TaxID=3140696 RepID=UPI0031373EBD|nr:hypothetical protein [Anaerolineae bacterium]
MIRPDLRPWLRASPAWRWLPWLLLLALGVRAWQLTFHSLWLDEVFSLFWASKPVGDIVRVGLTLTEDKHPPLYYLLLHGWIGLFGATDAAVRSLGVFLGALAVWPVYGLGLITQPAPADRPDHAWRRGALPALLLALNPFLVWYSQEARMFMPATTFGLWGLYAWLRALSPTATRGLTTPGRKIATFFWYGLAIGGLLAACYSYLFAAFLLPVAGLWWLVVAAPHRRKRTIEIAPDSRTAERSPAWTQDRSAQADLAAERPFGPNSFGALALAIMALLFLPLALAAWSVSGAEAAPGRPFADLWPTLARLLTAYTAAPDALVAVAHRGRRRGRGRAALDRPGRGRAPGWPPRPVGAAVVGHPAAAGQFSAGPGCYGVRRDALLHPPGPGPVPGLGARAARAGAVAAVAGEGGNRQLCVALPGRAAVRVAGGPGLAARGLAHGRTGGVALCQTRRCGAQPRQLHADGLCPLLPGRGAAAGAFRQPVGGRRRGRGAARSADRGRHAVIGPVAPGGR